MDRLHMLLKVVHPGEGFAAESAGHILRVVEVHELDVTPRVVRLLALVLAQRAPEPNAQTFNGWNLFVF